MSDLSLDTDQTALLNEILLTPSHELLNDRFNSADSAGTCQPGACNGSCSG